MQSNFSKYSDALKQVISEAFTGDVIIEPPDSAFRYAIEQTEDNLKFPFISIYPDSSILLDQKNISMPSYRQGINFQNPMNIYEENGELKGTNERLSKNVQFLYIILGYQIDVWGTTRLDAEETMQELLFWLYQNQEISIVYQGVPLTFNVVLGAEIVDNSDLASYTSNGKLYRFTYGIKVHATLLRSENYFNVLHPNIKIEELNKLKEE